MFIKIDVVKQIEWISAITEDTLPSQASLYLETQISTCCHDKTIKFHTFDKLVDTIRHLLGSLKD